MNTRSLPLAHRNRWTSLFLLTLQIAVAGKAANYDEAKVPKYSLPPLLVEDGGPRVTSAEQWTQIRRPQVFKQFEQQVFGESPSEPAYIRFRVDQLDEHALGGKAIQKEVTVFFSGDLNGPSMSLLLFIPKQAQSSAPAFLGLNFNGNHTVHPSPRISIPKTWVRNNRSLGIDDNRPKAASRGTAAKRWAVDQIIDRGYALVTAYYGDIDPDFDDGFQNGIHALFHSKNNPPKAHEWGSIATWSWGLSRALDYLEKDVLIDAEKVTVIGHSRLGKTALWAGARDTRFAGIISNNSGCGGAALSRREFGETVKRINTSFPHWFCDNFVSYNDRVNALPVDQHMLIALAAPRPIYIASATEDQWADPRGEFLSGVEASPVYQLFGMEGLGTHEFPEANQPIGERIGYHLRAGKHDVTAFDWKQYLDFADRHLR